jgi:hypothetical protein
MRCSGGRQLGDKKGKCMLKEGAKKKQEGFQDNVEH